MGSVIEMHGVSWHRGEHLILDGINWHVASGEHWAILGLNGSGKTTLLNMVNGYIWPSKGTVSVLGNRFGRVDIRELRKQIGWVSSALQERLYSRDTTQNVVISGKYASIGLYDQITDEDINFARNLMERLDCLHVFDRPYQTCSQGEKQKVLIARALMAKPRLLILDEATNGLDFISREALLSSITQLAQEPDAPTFLFATHHIEEIPPIFNRTLLLQRGRVFEAGATQDVLTSARLSAFFEMPVEVRWQNERAWVAAQPGTTSVAQE